MAGNTGLPLELAKPVMADTVGDTIPALAANMQIINDAVETHLSDYAAHGDILSRYRTDKDAEGIFITIEWKRPDGTLAKKSVLSGGTSPQYEIRTVTYYKTDGIIVKETVIYDQFYDVDGDWTHEVIQ